MSDFIRNEFKNNLDVHKKHYLQVKKDEEVKFQVKVELEDANFIEFIDTKQKLSSMMKHFGNDETMRKKVAKSLGFIANGIRLSQI
jgi:hypothetical protein